MGINTPKTFDRQPSTPEASHLSRAPRGDFRNLATAQALAVLMSACSGEDQMIEGPTLLRNSSLSGDVELGSDATATDAVDAAGDVTEIAGDITSTVDGGSDIMQDGDASGQDTMDDADAGALDAGLIDTGAADAGSTSDSASDSKPSSPAEDASAAWQDLVSTSDTGTTFIDSGSQSNPDAQNTDPNSPEAICAATLAKIGEKCSVKIPGAGTIAGKNVCEPGNSTPTCKTE